MAKKRKVISTNRVKKERREVTNNPFEIRINRKKHDIMGRMKKHEKGMPGVARSRALKKRQTTLLPEYKNRNKANSFVDRRFGEYNPNLTPEEKMLQRFKAEKQKRHEKSGVFNLEEEELTHFGQSLAGITKFDDVRLSDEEQEDEDIGSTHFGGFLKKRDEHLDEEGRHRSRKEIMDEVVAKSKQMKHERQAEKEVAHELTDKLDEEWQSVRSLLKIRDPSTPEGKKKADEYDIAVREMAFEVKAKASSRLKTDEEIAHQEEARLKTLEEERIRRMKGLPVNQPVNQNKPKHVSADDLGDSFTPKIDDRYLVRYDDGKMVLPECSDDEDDEEDEDDNNDEDNEDEDEEDDEDIKDQEKERDESIDDGDDDEEEDDDNEDEVDEEEDNSDDSFSDVDSDKESSTDDEEENEKKNSKKQKNTPKEIKEKTTANSDGISQLLDEVQTSMKTEKDLPYTFEAPKSYKDFQNMVKKWSYNDQVTIVERIHACNHPKLIPGNKKKMEKFFEILSQYFIDLCDFNPPPLKLINNLARPLFDLAQHSPLHSCQCTQRILQNLCSEYKQQHRKGAKVSFPGLKQLFYIRLISLLFPTSDLQHGVCTPAMLFLTQALSQCTVKSIQDLIKGLFICNLLLEFVSFSKRFIPEVITFLYGTVYMASRKNKNAGNPLLPFKHNEKCKDMLVLQEQCNSRTIDPKLHLSHLMMDDGSDSSSNTDQLRVQLFNLNIHLLMKFSLLYKSHPSFTEIFHPVVTQVQRVVVREYPQQVQDQVKELETLLSGSETAPRKHLSLLARKPQAIKIFEPKFDDHYEVKSKRNKGSKVLNEKSKLKYKYKKEMKGAVREIRKDTHFLAAQQLKEQLDKDAERKAKVKEIERLLAGEQAEVNVINRKKRKMR